MRKPSSPLFFLSSAFAEISALLMFAALSHAMLNGEGTVQLISGVALLVFIPVCIFMSVKTLGICQRYLTGRSAKSGCYFKKTFFFMVALLGMLSASIYTASSIGYFLSYSLASYVIAVVALLIVTNLSGLIYANKAGGVFRGYPFIKR